MKLLLLLSFIIILPSLAHTETEFGAGIGIDPWYSKTKKKKKEELKADDFTVLLAKSFDKDENELAKLRKAGYGQNELIKLLLISKEGNTDLKDILHLRSKKKKRLSFLCEKYSVDYPEILSKSKIIRTQIDKQVTENKYLNEINKSTDTTNTRVNESTGSRVQ